MSLPNKMPKKTLKTRNNNWIKRLTYNGKNLKSKKWKSMMNDYDKNLKKNITRK